MEIYPPTQKATAFEAVDECVEGTLRSSYERSGVCFGGFRPTKHVEEPRASARGGSTFDVRILNGAPLSFRHEVIKSGRLILTKDEESRIDFETLTFSHYFDFVPLRDRYLREVLSIGSK